MNPMQGRLPLGILAAYGIPGLPMAALGLPLFIYLPTFYATDLGLSLTAVGAILLLARLWDGVTDPIIGVLSDRTHTRWGRRRPWIIGATPLVLVSLWMLFVPPAGAGTMHLLVWSMALYLGWTMLALPHAAWGAELSGEYHERSRITASREIFVVLGTLVAAGLPVVVTGGTGPVLKVLAISLLVALPLAVLIACVFVGEPGAGRQRITRWQEGMAVLVANRPFRRLIAAYLLNGIANGLPATLVLLFAAQVLQLAEMSGIFLVVYFGCGILFIPLWLALSRRLDKHRSWCVAMLLNCAFFAPVPLLGAGDFAGFMAICVLTGLCLGADLALPPSMQADVVDVDTAETGEGRAGLYFALWGMATKLALALAVGIAFPLLDLAGFDANAAPGASTGAGVWMLVALYSLAPIAFKLAAIALMWNFPISAAAHSALKNRLVA
ncbi:MAG: MFS transporter [Alphaproteobacteria bacterium]|nr:MFS transporter [Alphaproteobacteria bacterium]MBU0797880.1 MFS transporter [Alphaproteobacteria bacterium]MBU0886168.1 MFS transporter [Alphaproteobacteria bacterium]MBU1812808.1 MFS transporter [Alphaproteobacteria bacterium]